VNNKVDETEWKKPNGDGYIFEDLKPFKAECMLQKDQLNEQPDVSMADDFEGRYDLVMKREAKLTNQERGRIISQTILSEGRGDSTIGADQAKKKRKKKNQIRKIKALEYEKIVESSENSSSPKISEEKVIIWPHDNENNDILRKDDRMMFVDLMKDWRTESSRGLENTILVSKVSM
jgi:hypothetical protein